MTEAVVAQRNTVLADGFSNPLSLAANAEDADHVKVYGDDELLTLGDDYTLDGVGDLDDLDGIDGVEVTIDDLIIAGGEFTTFTVEHEPPLDQEAPLAVGGGFGAAFEDALDAVVRRLQALGSRVDRAFRLPVDVDEGEVSVVLPAPVAGRALKWNEAGTALENSITNPDTGDVDLDALVALVQPPLEENILEEIDQAVTDAETAETNAAASAAASAASAAAALASASAAEAAQTAAELAQAAAEAAAGANSTVEAQIVAASTASSIADGDYIGVVDISAANILTRRTWTNVKAFLKTYFDGLYSALGHTHSFSSLTSKPTTRSGYGLTDAADLTPSAGAIGSYCFCYVTGNTNYDHGDTRSGSGLRPCNSDDVPSTGSTLSGTWRCMGNTTTGDGDQRVTLWVRIS